MFEGWLIKCGGVALPMEYILEKSYTVTPNQRLDLTAERDMTGVLHRDTVAHMPVKIEFNTLSLDNIQAAALNGIIQGAYTDPRSRTLNVTYYDPEEDTYKAATCYIPDTDYKIAKIHDNTIIYEPLRYAFIEY